MAKCYPSINATILNTKVIRQTNSPHPTNTSLLVYKLVFWVAGSSTLRARRGQIYVALRFLREFFVILRGQAKVGLAYNLRTRMPFLFLREN